MTTAFETHLKGATYGLWKPEKQFNVAAGTPIQVLKVSPNAQLFWTNTKTQAFSGATMDEATVWGLNANGKTLIGIAEGRAPGVLQPDSSLMRLCDGVHEAHGYFYISGEHLMFMVVHTVPTTAQAELVHCITM